jgi:hypothetical protein
MILFRYPKLRHRRKLSPGPFATYQQYKPFLREEFGHRCVYCRLADVMVGGVKAFTVDHYYSKKFYPHLETQYDNLFYACPECNRWKHTWPFTARGKRLTFIIPNPCAAIMSSHLEYEGARVVSRSEDGARTLEVLHLNNAGRIELRELWLGLASNYVHSKDRARALKRHLKKRKSKLLSSAASATIAKELSSLDQIIEKLDPIMKQLVGRS